MLQSPLSQLKSVRAYLTKSILRLLLAILAIAWTFSSPETSAAEHGAGEWQEKTQIVWDAGAARFVRRSFRVFDPHPELGLEFYWTPASESGDKSGAISGSGELIWYRRGASPYDYASRYSTYRGSLKEGKLDGWGTLSVRSGLRYEGVWKDGRMEGEGAIESETGHRYRGPFVAGKPDVSGTDFSADGQIIGPVPSRPSQTRPFRPIAVAKASTQIPLALSPPPKAAVQAAPKRVAQASGPIAITLYSDRVKNDEFKESNVEVDSFVYDVTDEAGTVKIRLDAPDIMARWKGDAALTADPDSSFFLLEPGQFAPVFLVVDVVNDSRRDAQIVGGYIDAEQSATDWQPYFEITDIDYFSVEDAFDPTFTLLNEGWGQVQEAKITYSFGKGSGASGQTFSIDVGPFDESKEVSTLPGFIASGVNVEELKKGPFPCPSVEEVPDCLAKLVQSGIFGQLGGAMFAEYTHVYTQISGMLDYGWKDSHGSLQQKNSPISVRLPVLEFDFGGVEFGAPGAVERKLPVTMLALDQEHYRIPLNYRGRLKGQQNLRFALTLDAKKSSHHQFKIVLQLADGSTVSSAPIDLLMFRPRAAQLY